MIEVTRLQGQKMVINAELIEFVEETPDTLIVTNTGKRVMIKESVKEVVDKVIEYRKRCTWNPPKEMQNEELSEDNPPPA